MRSDKQTKLIIFVEDSKLPALAIQAEWDHYGARGCDPSIPSLDLQVYGSCVHCKREGCYPIDLDADEENYLFCEDCGERDE